MTKSMIFFLVVTTCIMVGTIAFLPQYDIIVSAGIRILAMAIAIYYTVRFKEWRIIPLAIMYFFMAVRQILTFLIWLKIIDNTLQFKSISEIPGIVVTLLTLSSICYFGYLISGKNKTIQNQSSQINQLKDLLPICSKCKKVRNDEGYWQQIDTYIEQNTDTEFSHGLCEDCMKELYGNEPWYKNIEDRKKT